MARGKLIVLEGIGGCGKTTVAEAIRGSLSPYAFVHTHEPGGTEFAERVRRVVKGMELSPFEQLLLFEAARSHHVREVINPALKGGTHVLCDRFSASTYAYQVAAGDTGEWLGQLFYELEGNATGGLEPDLWIFLDAPIVVCMGRRANAMGEERDVFDEKDASFQERVRAGISLYISHRPHVVVNADQAPEDVLADTIKAVLKCVAL